MSEVANLIAQLEAAAEGSREMDEALGKIAGVIPEEATFAFWDPESGLAQYHWQEADGEGGSYLSGVEGPRYTRSLDAALTLVPEQWTAWEIRSRGRKTRFSADLSRLTECDAGENWAHGRGPTPALALCIAALKARIP